MRCAFWMTLASLSLASVGAACGSFGTAPPPDASTPDADGGNVSSPDAAPLPDGSLPPPAEDGRACTKITGPSAPCVDCAREPLLSLMPASSDEPGPFVFGLAVDKTTLYWLEQSGPNAYDGAGTTTLVRAKPLGAPLSEVPRTIARVVSAYTRIVVTPTALWLASTSQATQVGKIEKSCSTNCTPKLMGMTRVASSVTAYDGGLALGDAAGFYHYVDDGNITSILVPAGVSSLTRWGAGLAYVSEGTSASNTVVIPDGVGLPLLSADPNAEKYPLYGASHIAASCGEPLWARQTFRQLVDSGARFHSAIVQVNGQSFAFDELTFAMMADTTHAYLGLPNGGGVRRVGKGDLVAKPVVSGVSAWSLALDDTYVYFDDHGTDRKKASLGIHRMKKAAP